MYFRRPLICAAILASSLSAFAAEQPPAAAASLIEDAFHTGLLLRDTNGDSIADAVCAHIVVPDSPNEGENVAAANLAARLGYESSGITLPIVTTVAGGAKFHAQCSPAATNLWVGRGAVPAARAAELEAMLAQLQLGEGGVFSLGGGLAFAGADSLGLLSATNAYAARAPYQWSLAGPQAAGTCGSTQCKAGGGQVERSCRVDRPYLFQR